MTSFWTGVLVGATLMPMLLIVVLGCWALWWGPTRRQS